MKPTRMLLVLSLAALVSGGARAERPARKLAQRSRTKASAAARATNEKSASADKPASGDKPASSDKHSSTDKHSSADKPAPADKPTPPAPSALRGPVRIDFDDRLVQGQTNKLGAVYLYQRKDPAQGSLLERRKSFREEIAKDLVE
jgi:hypothetical protein